MKSTSGEPDRSAPELDKVAALAKRVTRKATAAVAEIETTLKMAEVVSRIASAVGQNTGAARMVNAIVEQLTEAFDACCAVMHLADQEKQVLQLAGHHGLPPELAPRLSRLEFDAPFLASRAASTREIQVVPDRAHLDPELVTAGDLLESVGGQCIVSVPIQTRELLVGVVTFVLPRARSFSPDEVATLECVSSIAAVGLRNALAHEAERELSRKLGAVSQAVLAFARYRELSVVLKSIVDQARVIANARFAALGVVTDWDQPFSPWVFSGLSKEDEARIGRHPRPVGTLGEVVKTGRPLRIADVRKHPAFRGWPEHHPDITSFLAVPIIFNGKGAGNLYLGNREGAESFTVEDEQAVLVLASHAGAAIENARLHDLVSAERSRLATILESSPHGIVYIERDWRRVVSNPAADAIAGEPLSGLSRESYLAHVRNPDGSPMPTDQRPTIRALRGELVSRVEAAMARPDGSVVPVLMSAAPVRGPGGEVTGAVVAFEDVSVLKELERLREEFASIVAHDLRNPVSSILMNIEMLLREAGGKEQLSVRVSSLERVRRSALRLGDMVKDLLDASRIEVGRLTLERKPVDAPQAVTALLDQVGPTLGNHPLELDLEGVPAPLSLDLVRFDQILTNLLEHAAKYSPEGAPIRVLLRAAADGRGAVISVRDQGIGIAAEDLPRLFDRFYQAKRAREKKTGLGLGLYITKGLVEAHGGRIWVESLPDRGSTFHVWLPYAEPPGAERAMGEEEAPWQH